jgi:hypothetical protein
MKTNLNPIPFFKHQETEREREREMVSIFMRIMGVLVPL